MSPEKLDNASRKQCPSNARRKPSKPWDTVLKPYLAEINEMRQRRRPVSLRKVAEELFRRHGLRVSHSTIKSAIRAREKEVKAQPIHPSFLSTVIPNAGHLDPIEVLRRKTAAKTQSAPDAWDQLEDKIG